MFCQLAVVCSGSIASSTFRTEKSLQVWDQRITREGSFMAKMLNLLVQEKLIVQLLIQTVKLMFGEEITMVNVVRSRNLELTLIMRSRSRRSGLKDNF